MEQSLQDLVAGLSPEQLVSPAGKALAHRLLRTNFEAWCRFALRHKGEEPAKHHRLVIKVIEDVTEGRLDNVIVLMPPGSAKSTYLSVLGPPWYLNRHPQNLILACSYAYSLIEGFGRQCRDLIKQYSEELGIQLSETAAASGDWRITAGGGYFCAGVSAGIAGHRADLGFIDDFIGSEEEAYSETVREKQWKWYLSDFCPRLKPSAAQIIIANRRHEEDLVGMILASEKENWTVIKIPMEATDDDDVLGRKKGEILWPEWFAKDEKALAKIARAKKNAAVWSGLFQQNPTPEQGDYFKKEYIVTYKRDELPKELRIYVGSDYALKRNNRSDYTCFLPAGVDTNGNLWILPDWYWTQVDTLEAVDQMLEMSRRRRPICWWAGRENITGSIAPFLYERMRHQNTYIPIEELSESQDKEQKAQSIKARMSAKSVFFPEFAAGWPEAYHQLLSFPNGKHDDFVDALAKLGQGLDKMTPANRPEAKWDGIVRQKLDGHWLERSDALKRRELSSDLY